jgi:hypothetical protein
VGFALVVLDDQREQIEPVRLRCARLRLAVELAFDLVEGLVVFGFGADWTDHFLRHDTVSGLMQSAAIGVNRIRVSGRSKLKV